MTVMKTWIIHLMYGDEISRYLFISALPHRIDWYMQDTELVENKDIAVS